MLTATDFNSIPTRRELVKEAARNPTSSELKLSQTEHQEHLWNEDPLTLRPLATPVVSDSLGRLFNKESILEFLLPSDDNVTNKAEQSLILKGTVNALKDVVEVKFHPADSSDGPDLRQTNGTRRNERWICPITNKELGAATKAVYLVPCGHAFAESAVKEISGDVCLQCNAPFAPNDVIPILPTSDLDISRLTLRAKSLQEKSLSHSLKKLSTSSKKRKKMSSEVVATETQLMHKSASINNAATASLTQKVMKEEQQKRRKLEQNKTLNSLFSSGKDPKNQGKNNDFMTRGFAVPNAR